MRMSPPRYHHRIVCLNGLEQGIGKYQLQLSEISQHGRLLQRARWNFSTFKGLLTFLRKYFPDSELLSHEVSQCIQFQVVKSLADHHRWEETVAYAPGMPSQLHPDREPCSTLPGLARVSCD
jgi:hypothetical protein